MIYKGGGTMLLSLSSLDLIAARDVRSCESCIGQPADHGPSARSRRTDLSGVGFTLLTPARCLSLSLHPPSPPPLPLSIDATAVSTRPRRLFASYKARPCRVAPLNYFADLIHLSLTRNTNSLVDQHARLLDRRHVAGHDPPRRGTVSPPPYIRCTAPARALSPLVPTAELPS